MKPLVAITGASAGIGEATARLFSENGYPTLLMARRVEKLEEMNLPNSVCRKVDVNNRDEIRSAVEDAQAEFGPVDCLINNAGILYLGRPWEQDPEEWERMMQTNIMGVLNGTHVVLKDMMERETGTIINISSIAGRLTFSLHAAYCGTKFAVHAISETIRKEVAHTNVRVITVAPGSTDTDVINLTTKEEHREKWRTGVKKKLTAEDVARSILFTYEQPQYVCISELVISPTK